MKKPTPEDGPDNAPGIDWPYKRPCTKKELAQEVCSTTRFIEHEVNSGRLRAVRLGTRNVRFLPSDIVRWLNANPSVRLE